MLGLKWQDVDFDNGIFHICRQVARIDGEVVEAPLKTKNSYRNVAIGSDAVEILKTQKEKVQSEYVFPSPTGGPISPDSVLHMLHRVLERAGLPKVRFHDLRHTFATLALQNGVDVKTVSGMLGHYSAGFTLDTYAHVTHHSTKASRQYHGLCPFPCCSVLTALNARMGHGMGQSQKSPHTEKQKKALGPNGSKAFIGCGDRI